MLEMTLGTWRLTLERLPPTPLELKRMYDASAARWHRSLERLGYLRAYRGLFQCLQTAGAVTKLPIAARILDAGIGTGALSLALAQTIGVRFHLDGVDISTEMLHQAHQTLNQISLAVTLTQRDIRTLGFQDDTFDLVMAAHVLEHLPNPQVALDEMVRVLQPGARLLLIVSQPSIFTAFIQWRWRYTAYPPQQVQQWLTAAGLDCVQVYPLQGGLSSRTSIAYIGFKVDR